MERYDNLQRVFPAFVSLENLKEKYKFSYTIVANSAYAILKNQKQMPVAIILNYASYKLVLNKQDKHESLYVGDISFSTFVNRQLKQLDNSEEL